MGSDPRVIELGSIVAGRYRIGELLGRGGHGAVYEAEHVELGYPVAIKVLHAIYGRDPRRRARFQREAMLGAALRHRNIVRIYDVGELEDGSPFFVMERVHGMDLADVIDTGRLDAAATIEIGVQLLAALTALDSRGVIHRDIKPMNVMLERAADGCVEVKLLDFGISKALRGDKKEEALTADDCVLGTPQYMSPEQVRGEELDVRADLYSVGAVLYECLTGEPPFDADAPGAVLARILADEPRPVRTLRPEVPACLAAVIDRAVRKDRTRRFAHPRQMAEALFAAANKLALPRGEGAWACLEEPGEPGRARAGERLPHHLSDGHAETKAETVLGGGRFQGIRAKADGWWSKVPSFLPQTQRTGRVITAATVPMVAAGVFVAWSWSDDPSRADAEPMQAVEAVIATRDASAVVTAAPMISELPSAPPRIALEHKAPAATAGTPTLASAAPSVVSREPESILSPASTSTAERSIAAARRPLPARPAATSNVAELERRARTAFLAGRMLEATAAYQRATELAPTRASAYRGLGLTAASSGQRLVAIRALRRYLALAPHAPDRDVIERRLAALGI